MICKFHKALQCSSAVFMGFASFLKLLSKVGSTASRRWSFFKAIIFPLGSCALYVDTPISTDPIQYIWCQNPQSLRWCLPKQPPIKIQYGQQVSVHQQCRLNLGILDVSSRRRITSKKQETRGSRYGDRKKYFDGMNIFVVFWL
jgi:hypothetical protein